MNWQICRLQRRGLVVNLPARFKTLPTKNNNYTFYAMRNKISLILLGLSLAVSSFVQGQALQKSESVSAPSILTSNVVGKTAAQSIADTLVNAATKTQTVKIPGYWDVVSIQANLTKISGTTAGKVYLLGSLDNVSFDRAGGLDSLTVSNVTLQSKTFHVSPSRYVFYRIQFVGTGTQSTRFNSLAVTRKK